MHEQAFRALKGKLVTPPVLKYPDFEQIIILTDASGEGLGAVISQEEVTRDLPVAFASRTLNQAETIPQSTWLSCGACVILDHTCTAGSLRW